jgi:hypothetical protein
MLVLHYRYLNVTKEFDQVLWIWIRKNPKVFAESESESEKKVRIRMQILLFLKND